MEILNYFIQLEIRRRHLNTSSIDANFDQLVEQLETISLSDYQRVIQAIFTPYELLIIQDLDRQYRQKLITKQKLYSRYLERKIESLELLLIDKEIEIGQLVDEYDHHPVTIVISFKYDLSLTFDFKLTPANTLMIDDFYQSGSLKSKVDFLHHIMNHHLIKQNDLIIQL